VLHVHLLVRAPFGMLRREGILRSNYLAFEVCSEARMLVRQTCIDC
jgi:hypothetical protein